MSTGTINSQKTALEFKSTSLTVPVLLLSGNDLPAIDEQLKEKVAQAPEFFRNSPLLIDLQKLNAQNLVLDFADIVATVRSHGFMPVGIRGGNEQQNQVALAMNLPVHSLHGSNTPLISKEPAKQPLPTPEPPPSTPAASNVENKLITQPVRSGQRVYAKGDLIVTATVSAGAEIMAEGNIHVYGSLRGRALAGVLGNAESRIFCSDLQAELISIAGTYQLRDDLSQHAPHKPVQISLANQKLIIKEL
ncbi:MULTISPECIES: septum site-determining protein MinC [Methylomonas]|uniref:Probable septum site-determining protein MinC n=1 Tax=Methylomonas koyamae TaxID=702114 RepID=A0A177NN33_9GAMM|nr:septum site-determining protein MinC [Methylomonas koyamae]NJA04522.1 septum site-determining protein MinC [Methylococcaceae bacterium WWC4]OAI19242.1 septum site-determining protein MinC [Methylomonas koyamae]